MTRTPPDQNKDPADASPIQSAVAELRAFVSVLKRRGDVSVSVATLGRKASKAELAAFASCEGIPKELVELYAQVNGVHIEWRFTEPPGGGCMRIPPLTQWTRFGGEEDHYMGFGEPFEALLLDEIQPEGGTWLVRNKESGKVRLVFASAAEGYDGIEPADSIASYLRAAMENGIVYYWPRCFRENRYVSYADQEEAIRRFRAPPSKPSSIRPGMRVQFEYFSESGRGDVLAVHEAPESRTTELYGRRLAQVKLDEGTIAWLPFMYMKANKKRDAYERLRDPSFDFAAAMRGDVLALFNDLARALGPLGHFSTCNVGAYPSNGRRAAGMLATRPLAEVIPLVAELHRTVRAARLDRVERRAAERSQDDFSATQFARFRYQYTIEDTFTGLFGGLFLLACHESGRHQIPGVELLPASIREQLGLAKIPTASTLLEALRRDAILEAPIWHHMDPAETAHTLGLPDGAIALLGTGY